jgi:hypothetical protein
VVASNTARQPSVAAELSTHCGHTGIWKRAWVGTPHSPPESPDPIAFPDIGKSLQIQQFRQDSVGNAVSMQRSACQINTKIIKATMKRGGRKQTISTDEKVLQPTGAISF